MVFEALLHACQQAFLDGDNITLHQGDLALVVCVQGDQLQGYLMADPSHSFQIDRKAFFTQGLDVATPSTISAKYFALEIEHG